MIEQLKTLRAGLETATCYSMLGVDAHAVQIALTALTQLEAMVGSQEPVAKLHDDGYWTPMKTEAGRALNDRLMRAGSPSIDVYAAPVAQQPQGEVVVTWNEQHTRILAVTRQDKEGRILSVIAEAPTQQPQAEAVPVVDRVYEAAKRLVDHADFQLGGVLSAKSKARDIPSNAASKVKARHLASLRDALAKAPQQAEAVPTFDEQLREVAKRAIPQQAEAVPFNHATQLQIAYVKGLGDGAMQAEAVPPDVVRDAVAYHWLTTTLTSPEPWVVFQKAFGHMTEERPPTKAELDAAIYAAIAQQKGASHD